MQLFSEVKGYATVDNAKKAAVKKGIDLDKERYMVVVTANGRYSLAFSINSTLGVGAAHMGFCVFG